MKANLPIFKLPMPFAAAALAVVGTLALFGALTMLDADEAAAQSSKPSKVRNLAAKQIEYLTAAERPGTDKDLARVLVSWTAPASSGGSAIASYKIVTQEGSTGASIGGRDNVPVHSHNAHVGTSREFALDDGYVKHNKWFRFIVSATNSGGNTGGTQKVDIRLNKDLNDRPGPVRNLQAEQISYTAASGSTGATATVRVRWSAPEGDGGSAVTGYKFVVSKGGTGDTISGSPTKVDAHSQDSLSSTTAELALTGNDAAANLWYKIDVEAINAVHTSTTESVEIRLNANFQPGSSAGSAGFIEVPTVPPLPPSVEARHTGLAVTIPAPPDNAGESELGTPHYTGFDIEYREGSAGAWMAYDGTITLNRRNLSGAVLVTGLRNGVTYEVRVRVTHGDGYGPWSKPSKATAPGASQPGKVRNLTVTQTYWLAAAQRPDSDEDFVEFFVDWDPPEDDGGSPVTSYRFYSWTGGTGDSIGSLNQLSGSNNWRNTFRDDVASALVQAKGSFAADNTWVRVSVEANNVRGTGPASIINVRVNANAEPDFSMVRFTGVIESDSTTSGAMPKLTVKIEDLPGPLRVGASVALYLEDDFEVPDSIPASSVYFVANSPQTVATGNGAPVYAALPPVIETDAYFDDGKDDVSIRVQLPDMCEGDSDACEGPNGLDQDQDLTMVILSSSGIKNPSEAGTHTVAYDMLSFDDDLAGRIERRMDNGMERAADAGAVSQRQGVYVVTGAKISLSDVDGERGDELTVNGSGFNNATTAAVYVAQRKAAEFAVATWWETLNCEKMKAAMGLGAGDEFCFHYTLNKTEMTYTVASRDMAASDKVFARHMCDVGVIPNGTEAGSTIVGSDDRAAVSFKVTVPTFMPGNNNLICMADGEGRSSGADYEDFELTPSIKVSPDNGRVGDEVTIFAQDFPTAGASLAELKVGGVVITDDVRSTSVSADGSATATFKLPPQKGIKRVDAKWGDKSEDAKVTILGTTVNVGKPAPLPNERVTITGSGFATGAGSGIMAENITIDGVPLYVYEDCLNSNGVVPVSSGGQFVCAVAVWPAAGSASNPTLTHGRHLIEVEDKMGFSGEVAINIPEPAVRTNPGVAGPRDVITISGESWPVDNGDNLIDTITVTVTDGSRAREYSVYADGSGRWFVEHQVSGAVPIPSTTLVEAEYEDLVKLGKYEVPDSIISATPGECQPGDSVTLMVENMPVHARVSEIEIGGRDVMPNPTPSTDGDGDVTVAVICPGLDEGTYSVELEVDDTVAIGSLDILPERPTGAGTPVDEALGSLGDDLLAVFYFEGVSKEWLFYDSRPEFAELNTLEQLVVGEPYWVLVSGDVGDVALGGKSRSFTCNGGNCWNLMVW